MLNDNIESPVNLLHRWRPDSSNEPIVDEFGKNIGDEVMKRGMCYMNEKLANNLRKCTTIVISDPIIY
jgi:hypothetical protein